ncbi:MAG: diaminopimelate decarboxylase [Chloroflexota bacterium]
MTSTTSKLRLFPLGTEIHDGHLRVGNCDVADLAEHFGTPLYIFHGPTIRSICREVMSAFAAAYPATLVVYASKAFLNPALAQIIKQEGLGLDVVSGGEISIARSVDFPADRVYFHGNNKTADELHLALQWGVGRIVVDNLDELELLDALCRQSHGTQDILIRVNPGVDPHTHHKTSTGVLDSKFGLPISTGQAQEAVKRAVSLNTINLMGLHFHLGSPVFELAPYENALENTLDFAAQMSGSYGLHLSELAVGGGFAVDYTCDSHAPGPSDYARGIAAQLNSLLSRTGLPPPKLIIEPGRVIVARAAVALYTVGAVKNIPTVRKYVSVDGGMSDNIRPALYGSRYEALNATKASEDETDTITVVGKLCESGDVLARDVSIARPTPGDIIAMPVAGAYSIPMASNYNAQLRPAIVLVDEDGAHLIRRRETYEDLVRLDLW